MGKLTKKRRVFVEEYLECWNATKAAEKAGYAHPGSQGSRLLQNVDIQALIEQRISEKALSADEVLLLLGKHARSDVSKYVDDTGTIDFKTVKEDGQPVRKITHRKGQHSSIELYDAQSALALLGKHHGLFRERMKIDAEIRIEGLADFMRRAAELERRGDDTGGSAVS
ncbi:unnamed protein product [marine sediment metagenome]|uniref:Terminase small subunit n=1 Tax=marine sediment metagenome TaxID=412755 RepID=X0UQ41_9ZZZZ